MRKGARTRARIFFWPPFWSLSAQPRQIWGRTGFSGILASFLRCLGQFSCPKKGSGISHACQSYCHLVAFVPQSFTKRPIIGNYSLSINASRTKISIRFQRTNRFGLRNKLDSLIELASQTLFDKRKEKIVAYQKETGFLEITPISSKIKHLFSKENYLLAR